MKITKRWLEKNHACPEVKKWFLSENILDANLGIQNLIVKEKLQWANWLLVRVLTHKLGRYWIATGSAAWAAGSVKAAEWAAKLAAMSAQLAEKDLLLKIIFYGLLLL